MALEKMELTEDEANIIRSYRIAQKSGNVFMVQVFDNAAGAVKCYEMETTRRILTTFTDEAD